MVLLLAVVEVAVEVVVAAVDQEKFVAVIGHVDIVN